MAELKALAKRVGDANELVKPINKKDVEGMSDAQVLSYLAENPNSVRRPIVDTGGVLTLGFTPKVREQLTAELARKPKK